MNHDLLVRSVQIPDVVHATARVAGADEWLRGLGALVADLEREWSLAVGDAYPTRPRRSWRPRADPTAANRC